ncbi:MAG: porin family protein [Hyphomicrobiales bacterium]|nr:porin family protein [Hyphomicrobiales bacterium]
MTDSDRADDGVVSMHRICLAAALILSGSMSGLAQEPRRTPVLTEDAWSGPYVGVIAGAASGRGVTQSVVGCAANGFLCDPTHYPENGAALSAAAGGSTSRTTFTAGVLVGFNWRLGTFVYGLEADASALHLSATHGGSRSSLNLGLTNPGPAPVIATISSSAQIDGVATLRARAGYLVSPSAEGRISARQFRLPFDVGPRVGRTNPGGPEHLRQFRQDQGGPVQTRIDVLLLSPEFEPLPATI